MIDIINDNLRELQYLRNDHGCKFLIRLGFEDVWHNYLNWKSLMEADLHSRSCEWLNYDIFWASLSASTFDELYEYEE